MSKTRCEATIKSNEQLENILKSFKKLKSATHGTSILSWSALNGHKVSLLHFINVIDRVTTSATAAGSTKASGNAFESKLKSDWEKQILECFNLIKGKSEGSKKNPKHNAILIHCFNPKNNN